MPAATPTTIDVTELPGLSGARLGTSSWHLVTQEQVNGFADVTGDHQWLHVDPRRAADGPFGVTVAHGYLTMSLAPMLLDEVFHVAGATVLNYGANRLRFPAPMVVGSRVRLVVDCLAVEPVVDGHQVTLGLVFEREGGDKPVCVAEILFRYSEAGAA